ncbi:hypothetical protein R1sor_015655 [Riccia sorocarpa]|uniref:Uncharacterized protein n=1 Tax=Riccia sorocarpa TaxID=122646 RepID=A0ABD3HET5_9MARC
MGSNGRASKISSYSGFAGHTVNASTHKRASANGEKGLLVIMASEAQFTERRKIVDIQEPKTLKKEILARLIATSAALVKSGNLLGAAIGDEMSTADKSCDHRRCARIPVKKCSGSTAQQVCSKPLDWCQVDGRKMVPDC